MMDVFLMVKLSSIS